MISTKFHKSGTFIKILLAFSAAIICFQAFAREENDYMVEIIAGKKVLKVESLDLPTTTRLSELLDLFPELLARESGKRFENYDLQIDGVSSGSGKDAILDELRVADIKKIEVTYFPSVSQQKKGQGGIINVILRDLSEGLSGSAMLYASSHADAMPSVMVNYKNKDWTVHSSLLLDYNRPLNNYNLREIYTPGEYTYQTDTISDNTCMEFLSLDAIYKPNESDKLRIWGWQNYTVNTIGMNSGIAINSISTNETSKEKSNKGAVFIGANYSHKFKKDEIETELTGEFNPWKYTHDKYNDLFQGTHRYWNYSHDYNKSSVNGAIKYAHHFVTDDPDRKIDLKSGFNFSYTPTVLDYDFTEKTPDDIHLKSNLYYLSPYIESDNVFGKFYLRAGLRYLNYLYDIAMSSDDLFDKYTYHFSGYIQTGYQIKPHHHISLILDRSVERGSGQQIYPTAIYDPYEKRFTVGNPNLLPASIHTAMLNYITDFKVGKNDFTFDAEVKYINTSDIICAHTYENYIYYDNDGKSNTIAGNLMFMYSRSVFSIALTANIFDNFTYLSGIHDHYFHYNIGLVPNLKFNDGWVVSAKFVYNSNVFTKTSKLSDYFYAQTHFSKTWGNWTAYLELDDNFHKLAEDIYYREGFDELLQYTPHRPSFGLGVHFKF